MNCFLCKEIFKSPDLLVKHFKKKHDFGNNNEIRCAQESCSQYFDNISSFKRHLQRKHGQFQNEFHENNDGTALNLKENEYPTYEEFRKHGHKIPCEDDLMSEIIENNEDFAQSALKFTLFLYNCNNMPRKDVQIIQKKTYDFIINPLLKMFKNFADNHLRNNVKIFNVIYGIISSCRNGLLDYHTEHKVEQKLISLNIMKDLKEVVLNKSIAPLHKNGTLTYSVKMNKGCVMPLNFYFKHLFEKDNLLQEMLTNIKHLKNCTKYTNFVNGQLYKAKEALYPDRTLIPYFLYFDDVEINNALGSHATIHSICNAYVSFPCFPKKESKVENVFLAAIFKSKDVKTFGNKKCFKILIDLLVDLEINGLAITCNGKVYKIYFVLGLIVGDNLGLNSVLNFNQSFSSKYYCRLCKASKKLCQKLCFEKSELLRTPKNYFEDVAADNYSVTGVKEVCAFNKIPSFHAVENFYVDTMHDVFEGVCHYDFSHILLHFIEKMNYFDINTLNSRKKNFNYGSYDIGNISGPITHAHLINRHFKMSASEMLTFSLYFPLMVGDLVTNDDEVWQFLLCLVEIIDIILSYEISEELVNILRGKIELHNSEYIRLFNTLKPKHHNLLHYPNVLRMSGPLKLASHDCPKYNNMYQLLPLFM